MLKPFFFPKLQIIKYDNVTAAKTSQLSREQHARHNLQLQSCHHKLGLLKQDRIYLFA